MLKTVALTLAIAAALAAAVLAAAVYLGLYNIAATEQHTAPVYWLLETAMRRSVFVRARDITPPPLDRPETLRRGLRHYHRHCVQCHGAPGVARGNEGKGMTPVPVNLAKAGREWPAPEIYWVIKHGIKMTGMPAWKYRMSEDDLWAVAAFVKALPTLSPADYQARLRALADGPPISEAAR